MLTLMRVHKQVPPWSVSYLQGARDPQSNRLPAIAVERILSDEDANHIRDRIYDASHQGSNHQSATPSGAPQR